MNKKVKKSWLNNLTIVISGASSGIGKSLAFRFINEYNAKVIGLGRNEEKLQKIKEELGDNFSYELFDVGSYENWQNFANKYSETQIDMLINCAGIMPRFAKYFTYSLEDAEKTINTNLMSVIYSTMALKDNITKSKQPSIVNISSAAGLCAVPGEALYCTSKFAVRALTETLTVDYKDMYVAGVYPGFIKTNIMQYQTVDTSKNVIIEKFSMPVEKMTKKLVKKLHRRKKRIVMGIDGTLMNICYKFFPKLAPKIIKFVFKASKEDLFKEL